MSKNSKVKIELEKAGCETISINCPQKVKLTVLQTLFVRRLPPLNVKPIDKKGLGGMFGVLAIISVIMSVAFNFYGVMAAIGVLVLFIMMMQNYYVSYIQKKLKEGYEIIGNESKKIVEEAGVLPLPSNEKLKRRKIFYSISSGVIAIFFLLSFILGERDNLEESARPIVTELIQEQMFVTDIECEKVKIDKKVSDGFYKATAILSSGDEIEITIKEMSDDQIQVMVPYPYNLRDYMEETACPLVSEILQDQLFIDEECEKVTIDEKVADGFYKATAILSSGDEIRIRIKEMSDDQIQVVIPYNQ